MDTEKETCEDREKPTNQGERPQKITTLPNLDLGLLTN